MFQKREHDLIARLKRRTPVFDQSCGFNEDSVPPLDAGVLATLEDIYGRASVKSIAQAQFITWLMTTQNDLIAVLPTGGGKSLSFLLPALMESETVSVVIAPFVAIEVDYSRKLDDLGIPFCQWPQRLEEKHRVILTSLETANMDELLILANNNTRITHLILDEAHLAHLWSSFRPHYCLLRNWKAIPIQKILLTATLPPTLYGQMISTLDLDVHRTAIIRDIHTQRPEVEYRFEMCSGSNEEDLDRDVVRLTNDYVSRCSSDERVILFVKKIADAERLVGPLTKGNLRPIVFHSRVESRQDRYWEWFHGGEMHSRILIGTSGIYHGIDHPRVVAAIFRDSTDSVIEFAQASGRVARGLDRGVAHVVVSQRHDRVSTLEPGLEELISSLDRPLFEQLCRRLVLSRVLDNNPLSCFFVVNSILCDVCQWHKVSFGVVRPSFYLYLPQGEPCVSTFTMCNSDPPSAPSCEHCTTAHSAISPSNALSNPKERSRGWHYQTQTLTQSRRTPSCFKSSTSYTPWG